jgi:hypothetical protein
MKDYTVVGYHEDNTQVWVEHTQANDADMAVAFAVCQMAKSRGIVKSEIDAAIQIAAKVPELLEFSKSLNVLSVFEGHHQDQLESTTVFCAYDHPEIGGDQNAD